MGAPEDAPRECRSAPPRTGCRAGPAAPDAAGRRRRGRGEAAAGKESLASLSDNQGMGVGDDAVALGEGPADELRQTEAVLVGRAVPVPEILLGQPGRDEPVDV